jgi:hypothetical protein
MADERTMSAVTMINTAQRNRQKVNVVIALTQVRAFYVQKKPRVRTFSLTFEFTNYCHPQLRKSAHPNPTVKFFNIQRLLCPIDNDEGREEAGGQANYEESEDEEDIDLKPEGSTLPSLSAVLPIDEDVEIDLCSDELAEILADGPIPRATKSKVTEKVAVAMDEVDNEDDGVFELNDWV